ncbi:uncharacterized protein PB18E9.04c-like [Notolabrus celidotus]|uniref:uncharacterized protein PB18E9.04c-like n=1 Tax=Notolabrus celidotus TaxID=1203425 RepID=UPI00148F8036|nr:uncharacterized protein PB18E9.04c-like [Notolabrus celidotus]
MLPTLKTTAAKEESTAKTTLNQQATSQLVNNTVSADVTSPPVKTTAAQGVLSSVALKTTLPTPKSTSSAITTPKETPLINDTSSAATTVTTTTALEKTTTAVPVSEATVKLEFKMLQNFTTELGNESSTQFKTLSDKVTTALDNVYSKEYGERFSRSVVNSFSEGSVVVDAELIFSNASSVPETSALVRVLVDAVSNSSNFSLSVDPNSIVVKGTSTTTPSAPTTTTLHQTTAANATVTPSNALRTTAASPAVATDAPSSTTAAPTTEQAAMTTLTTETTTIASTDPPSSSEGTLGLQFKLNQTFTSDLSNSSSIAYKTLSITVTSEVNKVCQRVFPSTFRRSIVDMFTRGSVVVDMTLVFKDKSSVPSASSTTAQLSSGLASSSTSLNIVSGSVVAYTSTSNSPPRPTVALLAVLSLSLAAVTYMLTRP